MCLTESSSAQPEGLQLQRPSVLRPMMPADLDELMIVQREGAQVGLGNIFPQEQFPFPVDVVRHRWEAQNLCDLFLDHADFSGPLIFISRV